MENFTVKNLFPILLYAETHYKFKGIYSRFFKREPEIVADAPTRIEPGDAIPVLVLIKDAHRFPIQLVTVTIELKHNNALLLIRNYSINISIDSDRFWHRIFYIEPLNGVFGIVELDVSFKIKITGKNKKYNNDNYRISSHQPLSVYLAKDPLPRFENWFFGDFHYHSNYTEDQVEFGAPLPATVEMARAMGLSFFAVTDHSYDLDDSEDSWVINDPNLKKWKSLWDEVDELNAKFSDFVILPGEEVSAGNSRNRNVHLLIINDRKFYPGKGDSAECWFRTKPDLSIANILDEIETETLALAGHPEMGFPFLQWLLIRRGSWDFSDYLHPNLHGLQLWNGELDHSFYSGSKNWVRMLLEGKRKTIVAGNDAHGNFNRFRQIGFPFFTMRETQGQLFGKMRTGVKVNGKISVSKIIGLVKNGRVQITTGPVVELMVFNEIGEAAGLGGEISGREFQIVCKAKSSSEFGILFLLNICLGEMDKKLERELLTKKDFDSPYHAEIKAELRDLSAKNYIRVEVTARMDDGSFSRCFTNPIWLKISK